MCQNLMEVQRASAFEKLDFILGICKFWLLQAETQNSLLYPYFPSLGQAALNQALAEFMLINLQLVISH